MKGIFEFKKNHHPNFVKVEKDRDMGHCIIRTISKASAAAIPTELPHF